MPILRSTSTSKEIQKIIKYIYFNIKKDKRLGDDIFE